MIDDKLAESISVYEVKAPVPSQSFRSICSQIEKVYQLLIDLLPETSIKKLFIQVDDKFKTRLKNRLLQLKVPRDGGPQYAEQMIFQDMTFYEKQLKNLPYLNGISTNFQDIWN
ncbi:vacuolar sorting-associated 54 isoform X2 [Brachionus plicatilis]|uniref:Vacuolar sorting-associated 54 isoform X2 n=1 Tax=Brachionus plicatilis TaxID=10195 RepID=A0A3M7PIZ1_BRAPC|nr:vacuolar sorting-associated 54 isoform X2 [Brachionus plicatilis]